LQSQDGKIYVVLVDVVERGHCAKMKRNLEARLNISYLGLGRRELHVHVHHIFLLETLAFVFFERQSEPHLLMKSSV
jgi:hypothetical protein